MTVKVVAGVRAIEVSAALFDILCTRIEYVCVVDPSCDVTTVVMVLAPCTNGRPCAAVPGVTTAPFTVTVAVGTLVVGVTVIE